MKGRPIPFLLSGVLAHAFLLFHGLALAYGSSSAVLEVSTVILPDPPPAIVQTLNAKKEVLAAYELHPSKALEKAHMVSELEEAKFTSGKVRIISVTFN